MAKQRGRAMFVGASMALLVFGAAACGSSSPKAVTTTTAAGATTVTTSPTTSTSAPVGVATTAPVSATTTAPATSTTTTTTPALTAAEAAALVKTKPGANGPWVTDTSDYDPTAALSGIIGTSPGGTGTSPEQLFLFHLGHYLGTATLQPRFAFQITSHTGDTITVSYAHYAPSDHDCCPSQPPYIVRYHWDGTKVVPLDPIPPAGQGMNP